MPSQIGTLAEKSLHAALKTFYARPGDRFEVEVAGYVIDIVRSQADGLLLLEIQSRNFSAIRRKLAALLEAGHVVRLIHPIAVEKWIVRQQVSGRQVARRRSPKRGHRLEVFKELVRIPHLLPHSNFSLQVALTRQEEIWLNDGQGSWRRKGWSIADHRLLDVEGTFCLSSRADFLAALAPQMERPFTNRGLAEAMKISTSLAGKITYTLRKAGWLEQVGMQGRAYLFAET
jgi:hypothetical protein